MLDEVESKPVVNGNSSKNIEIVSPRGTLLLSKAPTIRWHQVTDASYYVVSLMNGSEICWQQKVSGIEIVYPGNPPLEPGVLYSLTVESDNNFISASALDAKLGFKLLDSISAQEVKSRTQQIKHLKLAPEVEAFVLTNLYLKYGLNAEAIETLEKVIADGTQTFVVYRTLSELYQHIGLNILSEERSKTAQELEFTTNATATELLEQQVTKVLEQQAITNIPTELAANFLEQKATIEAVPGSQQFLICAVGQPCTTSAGKTGVWAYIPGIGCICRQ